ncbi:BREX-2 system adenine-specific DNA-methyltransferase PglX [Longispora sp. NPDC051575]|uniref:BREX-2 system adenine-specific DNA-methyltransferase PglX n=1 Tax=Longispora sp. NPDC051575 TaxID=3154943 RepID=UPI0034302C64
MIDRKALLNDLKKQVSALEKDLVTQVPANLEEEYQRAFKLGRTASTWAAWRDERVTQAAVAWVLGSVFVRFCEDNLLLEQPFLAGQGDRLVLAQEAEQRYFEERPTDTLPEWLLKAFDTIGESQAGRLLFDQKHNAAYQIRVSHSGAQGLIAFWRRQDASGLVHDFTDPEWDTRFLGDLYQDLSEAARKTYALLQTPEFVEEFILDLTLTPAINEFGHDVVRMIDPTCGSGHFVLGAFHRLLKVWEDEAPTRDRHELVNLALNAVHGVDINPFAIAIARFRLLIAAMKASGYENLRRIRGVRFALNLAIGDSLIKHRQMELVKQDGTISEAGIAEFSYSTEDVHEFPSILDPGRYHAVVGNPPYVTVKDKSLKKLYRTLYDSCTGIYALSVPFAQRFFELATREDAYGRNSGFVGQITANSFMKREFGKLVIEKYFAHRVDLTHILDTSGAFIPSHGTPTVILIGRHRVRNRGSGIRVLLSVSGEPNEPVNPSQGLVWQAIVRQVNQPDSESAWISSADLPREHYSTHPWNLGGGGANALFSEIEGRQAGRLNGRIARAGFYGDSHADELFTLPNEGRFARHHASLLATRSSRGDQVRDWHSQGFDLTVMPYSLDKRALDELSLPDQFKSHFWPWRSTLWARTIGSGQTYSIAGKKWWEWHQLPRDEPMHPWSIAFSEITTHNHFILSRDEAVFNRTAPILKLPSDSVEDDHLQILGLLNSSLACFWLKQMCQDKGNRGGERSTARYEWEHYYQFNSTNVSKLPLPKEYPLELSRRIDSFAIQSAAASPELVVSTATPSIARVQKARTEWHSTRAQMIASQEELDWKVYYLYGLTPEDLTIVEFPEVQLGQRAFEIVLARMESEIEWFERHGSTPITELPEHWPAAYKEMVLKRIEVIESNRNIALIERPECKRRWATEGFDKMLDTALRNWLLDRAEARELWFGLDEDGIEQPKIQTTFELADKLRRDPEFVSVAELYDPGKDLDKLVADLVEDQHVPFLAPLRYTAAGMEKRRGWEHVWDLQRSEDAAPDEPAKKKIRDTIPVPEKYKPTDFRKTSFWQQRGKLDVPKERFISYPHAGRTGDPALLLGWAGWDHREQAQALVTLAAHRVSEDGWSGEMMIPLLAGLRELLPWLRQWHGTFDPLLGYNPADVYTSFYTGETQQQHITEDALTSWQPPSAARGRRRKDA